MTDHHVEQGAGAKGAIAKTLDVLADSGNEPNRQSMLNDPRGRLCLKSWLASRLAVDVLGLLMPVLVIVGNWLLAKSGPNVRGSLSAYYHSTSGVRDVFVSTLAVIGIFLITYRINNRTWENGLTIVAGVAGIGVALFPTWLGDGDTSTGWQDWVEEDRSAAIHLVAAATFIIALAFVSLIFGKRDGKRGKYTYRAWHISLGCAMLGVVLVGLVLKPLGYNPQYGLLIVEIICTILFGLSWTLKGIELRQDITRVERQVAGLPSSN